MRWSWTFPLCLAKHDHQYHQAQDFHVRDFPLLAFLKRLADKSCLSLVLSLTAVSRRSQEAVQNDTIRNKSLGPTQPSLNGSSSPVSLHKPGKRLVQFMNITLYIVLILQFVQFDIRSVLCYIVCLTIFANFRI